MMRNHSPRSWQGRKVVVTGAAGNIGAATVRLVCALGASAAILDLDERAEETASEVRAVGARCEFFKTDVSSEQDVINGLAQAASFLGGIDVIVNNAGIQREAAIDRMSLDDWNAHMEVNARSCFLMTKYGVPYLEASEGSPAIVNMASIGGIKSKPGLTGYSASKGAIIAFTRTVAEELGPRGIRVNAVAPGWVDTPFNDPIVAKLGGRAAQEKIVKNHVPLGRQGTPEDVAESIVFLGSDAAAYVTGHVLVIDGGVT